MGAEMKMRWFKLFDVKILSLILIGGSLAQSVSRVHAQSPFEQEVFQANERALAWIQVNTSSGNYGDGVTSLGGLALLSARRDAGPNSPMRGYRFSDQAVRNLLIEMATYVINSDISLRTGREAHSFETGYALAFLAQFYMSGGPNRVGSLTTVSQALQNGIVALTNQQGPPEIAPINVCNTGGWNITGPLNDGDVYATTEVLSGLDAVQNVILSSTLTFDRVPEFLDNLIASDGGGLYRGCSQETSEATSPSTASLLFAYSLVHIGLSDPRVQGLLSWLQQNYGVDQIPQGDSNLYFEYLWHLSRALLQYSGPVADGLMSSDMIGGIRAPIVDGYPEESSGWRYDIRYTLLQQQLLGGSWRCEPTRGCVSVKRAVAYASLILSGVTGTCVAGRGDGDQVCDGGDNCPWIDNPDQLDQDRDGVGDLCDNCPEVPNSRQGDADQDGLGDVCDQFSCLGRTDEICDGLDNDCDGTIDEDTGQSGSLCDTGARGLCQRGVTRCVQGVQFCEQLSPPDLELCDRLDNDCDGQVDESNPEGAQRCDTGLLGLCGIGFTRCQDGELSCVQSAMPVIEVCDGLDNNCDGVTDEGNPGGGEPCQTNNQGQCSEGRTLCVNGGLICARNNEPGLELCDGLDNDCDGVTDEGGPGEGSPCSIEGFAGRCALGLTICRRGAIICDPLQAQAEPEICDGYDNDCDARTDEDVISPSPDIPDVGEQCQTACGEGTIQCILGALRCDGPQQDAGVPEVCNALDDDCDGLIDEGQDRLDLACVTGLAGECAIGEFGCVSGQLMCRANLSLEEATLRDEVCDTLDNDCDGIVDEDTAGSGVECLINAVGVCSIGERVCRNGSLMCAPRYTASTEVCDGQDNDCDGSVDEGLLEVGQRCSTGALGVCGEGIRRCAQGDLICEVIGIQSDEVCDGVDNDCDDQVDEGNLGLGGSCETGQLGVCGEGIQRCRGGAVFCEQQNEASDGSDGCDGLDNDCDGQIDEAVTELGLRCETSQSGLCSLGRQQCNLGALTCVPDVQPTREQCDGVDNDCDSAIDEGNPESGLACRVPDQRGLCGIGLTTCTGGAIGCETSTTPVEEECDGLDNDCDGRTDEETTIDLGLCDTGRPGSCAEGQWVCGESGLECVEVTRPYSERCDGLDNDCDGRIDEGELVEPLPCSTAAPGQCGEGQTLCRDGELVCDGLSQPDEELCDGFDNDCDGLIDEGLRNACGLCEALPEETCDGEDQDCDGSIDEEVECPDGLVCSRGSCVSRCESGECRDASLICVDEGCVSICEATNCGEGLSCRAGACIDLCEDVQCTNGSICQEGRCVGNSCYEAGCARGEVCLQNECVEDPCAEIDCGEGSFCRISFDEAGVPFGQCAASCATRSCLRGEYCENGTCREDECFEVACLAGQICVEGECQRDPCAGILCGPGRECIQGQCQDDPCVLVTCPPGQMCIQRRGAPECEFNSDPMMGGEEIGGEAVGGDDLDAGIAGQMTGGDVGGDTAGASGGVMNGGRSGADFGDLPFNYADEGFESASKESGCQSSNSQFHSLITLIFVFFGLIWRGRKKGGDLLGRRRGVYMLCGSVMMILSCQDPPPSPRLDIRLGSCLSEEERGCQSLLREVSGSGYAGCFQLQIDGELVESVAVTWSEGGLSLASPPTAPLNEGQTVRSTIIFAQENVTLNCTGLDNVVRTDCIEIEGCALKLTSYVQEFEGGALQIDFVNLNDQCSITYGETLFSQGVELPQDELDNDCDGQVDEMTAGSPCSLGLGGCRRDGVNYVNAQGEVECVTFEPVPEKMDEICGDNIDNDCDGIVDFVGLGEPCVPQGLETLSGRLQCVSSNLFELTCVSVVVPDSDDLCDRLDNDADGLVDEDAEPIEERCSGFEPGLMCAEQTWSQCINGDYISSCRSSRDQFQGEELMSEGDDPSALCDGADNDCDGQIDESFIEEGIRCGIGACLREGVRLCDRGQITDQCIPGDPTPERCDDLDHDCDGDPLNVPVSALQSDDENCGACGVSCGGIEEHAVYACQSGICQFVACEEDYGDDPNRPGLCECKIRDGQCCPETETLCDGNDDDCDGNIDEGLTNQCDIPTCNHYDGCNTLDDDCDGEVDEGDGLTSGCAETEIINQCTFTLKHHRVITGPPLFTGTLTGDIFYYDNTSFYTQNSTALYYNTRVTFGDGRLDYLEPSFTCTAAQRGWGAWIQNHCKMSVIWGDRTGIEPYLCTSANPEAQIRCNHSTMPAFGFQPQPPIYPVLEFDQLHIGLTCRAGDASALEAGRARFMMRELSFRIGAIESRTRADNRCSTVSSSTRINTASCDTGQFNDNNVLCGTLPSEVDSSVPQQLTRWSTLNDSNNVFQCTQLMFMRSKP